MKPAQSQMACNSTTLARPRKCSQVHAESSLSKPGSEVPPYGIGQISQFVRWDSSAAAISAGTSLYLLLLQYSLTSKGADHGHCLQWHADFFYSLLLSRAGICNSLSSLTRPKYSPVLSQQASGGHWPAVSASAQRPTWVSCVRLRSLTTSWVRLGQLHNLQLMNLLNVRMAAWSHNCGHATSNMHSPLSASSPVLALC